MLDVAIGLLHIELLAKAQIAQDVEYQIVDLLSHVQRFAPHTITTIRRLLLDQVQPSAT